MRVSQARGAERLGRLRSGPARLTGAAGQWGRTGAARLAGAAGGQESGFWNTHSGNACHAAFCDSWHICQHRGPRPPGQETSGPIHWDLGTDAFEVLPTPLLPCETQVFSVGQRQGGDPRRPGQQRWLCQAEGPMQHGWSGCLPPDRHPGEAAALE